MPCDGRMYADQVEGLKDLVSTSVQVLAYTTFAESAESLLASTDGAFILAGTAYGRCLAMEVLTRAPDRVRGLWLMNCQPGVHPNPDSVRTTSRRIRRQFGFAAETPIVKFYDQPRVQMMTRVC
jgi:pimeloyl-ACP methyl ester carboxylesterase